MVTDKGYIVSVFVSELMKTIAVILCTYNKPVLI